MHTRPSTHAGDAARASLVAIRRDSKEGLRELRAALDLLRGGEDPTPHHPCPTLADVEAGPRPQGGFRVWAEMPIGAAGER